MRRKIFKGMMILVMVMLLPGCGGEGTKFVKGDIKDDFCGVVINFQYCKCAFHNEYCDVVGMSDKAAKNHVYSEYGKWVEKRRKEFKERCVNTDGIVKGNKCKYCDDGQVVQDNVCVNEDKIEFTPDGPLNADCTIKEDEFEQDWKKYSHFDDRIEFYSRSWEGSAKF